MSKPSPSGPILSTLFGHPLSESIRLRSQDHSERFLRVLGIDSLRLLTAERVPQALLQECAALVAAKCDSQPALPTAASIYIYTTQDSLVDGEGLESAHGCSIVAVERRVVRHIYLQEGTDGSLAVVPELCVNLTSPPDIGTLRLMHLSNAEDGRLPGRSSIVALHADLERSLPFLPLKRDQTLLRQLLLDHTRNVGAQSLGLDGDLVFEALVDNDPGPTGGCGHMAGCESGNGQCVYPPGGPEQYCMETDTDCAAVAVADALEAAAAGDGAVVDFDLLRRFRDDVLSETDLGRQYTGYYYLASQGIRYDPQAIAAYRELLTTVYPAIEKLLDPGSAGEAVLTTGLFRAARRVIEINAGTSDPQLANVLQTVESDLFRWLALPKDSLVAEGRAIAQ